MVKLHEGAELGRCCLGPANFLGLPLCLWSSGWSARLREALAVVVGFRRHYHFTPALAAASGSMALRALEACVHSIPLGALPRNSTSTGNAGWRSVQALGAPSARRFGFERRGHSRHL